MMREAVAILIILLSFLSCERQDLLDECFCTNSAKLPITIDWSKSGISPQNITILSYNESDGSLASEHRYEHSNNAVHAYIYLPVGEYTVVVFNELRGQIRNVTTLGYENLSTLGFYATEDTDVFVRSTEKKYINQPGMLGVQVIRNLVVTNELIAYTHDQTLAKVSNDTRSGSEMLLNIIPDNKISTLSLTTHINGLNNARMPALVDLKNISNGYMVDEDKNSMTPAIQQFNMSNRVYDEGSTTDGTISTQATLFGALGDRNSVADQPEDAPIVVDILIMLVDKEKTRVNVEVDITDLLTFSEEESGSISMTEDLDFETPLQDVEPEDDGGGGFGSEVGDWDEVDVPL